MLINEEKIRNHHQENDSSRNKNKSLYSIQIDILQDGMIL